MTETLCVTAPLLRWESRRGAYHLVDITGEPAHQIAMHERIHRLEHGARRGFGSVKVKARIGDTEWDSSVFPGTIPDPSTIPDPAGILADAPAGDDEEKSWFLLIGRKLMRTENLVEGEPVELELTLL